MFAPNPDEATAPGPPSASDEEPCRRRLAVRPGDEGDPAGAAERVEEVGVDEESDPTADRRAAAEPQGAGQPARGA